MAKKSTRIAIPPDVAAQVLFMSDRTCCVCRQRGKPVQIHHIDDDSANNDRENLSVLCFDCHRETQLRGGFDRKLDAEQVMLYRDDWQRIVATDRAQAEVRREMRPEAPGIDVELVTSIAEIYREGHQYELLASHYDAVGNCELRDKYIEKALMHGPPRDGTLIHLRARLQGRPDLVPEEVIARHLALLREQGQHTQLARVLLVIGRRPEAATEYLHGINASAKDGNWFSAAFYLREFLDAKLLDELLLSAYRSATDSGELWWQVRALEELEWTTELDELLRQKREEIQSSGSLLLKERLAYAEGRNEDARQLRKEIARRTKLKEHKPRG